MRLPALLLLSVVGLAGCGEPAVPVDTGDITPPPPPCAEGHISDGGTCVPEACGTGTWGNLELEASTVYVDIEAAEGGDGSEGSPLRSIQAGLDLAGSRSGGTVAVAAGSYPETLALTTDHTGVHLAGRCRELVVLDASVGDDVTPGVGIDIRHGEVELSSLEIADASYVGLEVTSGSVRLEDLSVERSATVGLFFYRASMASPLSVDLRCSRVVGARGAGVWVYGLGAEVSMQGCDLLGTSPHPDGVYGVGVAVNDGARLTVQGGEIAGNAGLGLGVNDPGTEVAMSGCLVRNNLPSQEGEGGYGLQAGTGASLACDGCEITGNNAAGISALHSETRVGLQDCLVRHTVLGAGQRGGIGVSVTEGASAVVVGGDISWNEGLGAGAWDDGSELDLWGCLVRDNLPTPDGGYGRGVEVGYGARLSASGILVSGNTQVGIAAMGADTFAWVSDSEVSGTVSGHGPSGATAAGIVAQDGAWLHAHQVDLLYNRGVGLQVSFSGARLIGSDCRLIGNHFAGAVALLEGTLLLEDSVITGTGSSVDLGGGVGVYAADQWEAGSPYVQVAGCTITDNLVAGVHLTGAGSYLFGDNHISGSRGLAHGSTTRCGDGVYAGGVMPWDGSTGLLLEGNAIEDNQGAGLLLDDAWATLSGNDWSANEPDLLAQGGACLSPREDYAEAPNREVCPEWDRPTCQLEFRLNLSVEDIQSARLTPTVPHPLLPWEPTSVR